MKKILLIVPALHQGGFEKVCAVTARLLQPYYQVRIVIFDSKDIAYDIDGLSVTDLNLASRPGIVGKVLNVLWRGYRLHRLKKREGFDVSYSFGPTANLANIVSGGREKKWLGVRSYMDMENPRQMKLFCRHADRLVCCSGTIREEAEGKYGCRKAVTLYNPFDKKEVEELAGRETELPWEDGRFLISMGREDSVKGFWHLLKAFQVVHDACPDTKLLILGAGDFLPYKELAEGLGIQDAVWFPGMKKNPYPYLKKSALYVLTSYYEGFPNAMVEAMSLGVPVIATDCMTGPREILEDKYGILVPNMSREEDFDPEHITAEEKNLAAQILLLLDDREKMEHYQTMARQRAGDFTAEAYVEKIRTWIESDTGVI